MRRAMTLLLVSFLAGCSRDDEPPAISQESGLDREVLGFTLSETHEGHKVWELHAARAWRIPQDTHDHLEQVEILFYDASGRLDSRLTAWGGIVDEASGTMTAKDDVKLVSMEGDTLTTEELSYIKDEDVVRGPGFVRLAKPDRVLTGFEFSSKPDLTSYEIRRDVHITLQNNRSSILP